MKIYQEHQAPNPRRVRLFLNEKGIEMEYVQINLKAGENLTPEIKTLNPETTVPFLVLDDGTVISESIAICRYFEESQPEPLLFGRNPLEKAQVEMWQRRIELGFYLKVALGFQHITGYFSDRMTPHPEWGEDCKQQAINYLSLLEAHLKDKTWMLEDYFSIADITLLCAIDFARVIKIRLGDDFPNLTAWHNRMTERECVIKDLEHNQT